MRGTDLPSMPQRYASGKSPVLAMILSVLPGLGQIYNGDSKKGTLMLVVAVIGGAMTGGFVYVGMLIWSAIDGYLVASSKAPIW
jgi:TM2 domain-containing membrane protein YozV